MKFDPGLLRLGADDKYAPRRSETLRRKKEWLVRLLKT
jgi:hypothetical protein